LKPTNRVLRCAILCAVASCAPAAPVLPSPSDPIASEWIADGQRQRDSLPYPWAVLLRQFGESTLDPAQDSTLVAVYRFVWYPSFHPPLLVRLEHRTTPGGSPDFWLQTQQLNRRWSAGRRHRRRLGGTEGSAWTAAVELAGFWDLPTASCAGIDGACWFVEGADGSQRHAAWNRGSGALEVLGMLLVGFARLDRHMY
jgi:hypothetical protein